MRQILEYAWDILEQLNALLEDLDHLFEQPATILEDQDFIRTF